MLDDKDKLPSDAENGALEPRDPNKTKEKTSPTSEPDEAAAESDPSEQPS